MAEPKHPNKEIRAALKRAKKEGWRVEKSDGHPWGKIKCSCGKHKMIVNGAPRKPQNHAKDINKAVALCRKERTNKATETDDKEEAKEKDSDAKEQRKSGEEGAG